MNTPTIGTRTPDPDRLVSFHLACDLLGKTPQKLKAMIKTGKLKPADDRPRASGILEIGTVLAG